MIKKTENTQRKEGTSFQNVKTLNGIIQSGDSVSGLISDVKSLRKRIDALIAMQETRAKTDAPVKGADKAEKSAIPEKKSAKIIDDTPSATPLVPKSAPNDSGEGTRPESKGTALVSELRQEKQTPSSGQKEQVKAPAQSTATPQSAPAPQQKAPAAAAPTVAPAKSTYTPSYIRGEVIPPPPRPVPARPPQRPPYQNRGPMGQQRPGDNNRPPYQNRTGAPGQQRPTGGFGQRPPQTGVRPPMGARPPQKGAALPPPQPTRQFGNKKKDHGKTDERKSLNKRTLIRKGFITENIDDERMGSRKLKVKKQRVMSFTAPKVEKALITTENLTVKILSEKIGKTAQEIIKQLMVLGIVTNINSVVDFTTMELVANELGVEIELKLEQTKESMLEVMHDEADDELDLVKRPPIVTVMGHVDHGKTSLLDAIRKTSVVSGEAGGITQHIGAYSVVCKGERITFLDTPGHEAFTELRKRGANVTDIAILIVAADDGVMPQTLEAVNHAKAAKVPILVAINKIDKPGADPDKIRQELAAHDLVPEDWGGDTIFVQISAKRGDGIDKLLEMVLLLAEYNNFRANPSRAAKASIIEAKLDKGKGPVANIIIQNGTLRVGDFVVSGMTCGRVRAMMDEKGKAIKEAPPSTPVSILGFADLPASGEGVFVVDDEKMAKQVIEERNDRMRKEQASPVPKASLDELIGKINEGLLKELNIIIKGDVHGSVEALKISLSRLVNDEVRISIVHSGVGAINKSDIMLAEVSRALIIGFNVKPDAESRTLAEKAGIEIKMYDIIYEAIESVERIMKGMVSPKYRQNVIGRAQVRNVFKITGSGMIAGSYVLNGKLQRGAKANVYRGGEVIHKGVLDGLKRFKDDVKEVSTGFECGISVSGYTDIKEGDEIEAIIEEEIKS